MGRSGLLPQGEKMLHFALQTGGASPITDDQGSLGIAIFSSVLFDGTAGGLGDTKDIPLYLFNNDNTKKYNGPTLSINDGDPVALNTWFFMLNNNNVAGISPTQSEWSTYGVAGNLTLTLGNITQSGGLTPERKFWLRVVVPAGTLTANLTGVKLNAQSVEEAV